MAKKEGMPRRLRYKAHLSIDADSRIIVSIQVTTGACHESQVYIDHVKNISKELNLSIDETIADRGYGTGEILQALKQEKITAYIPLYTERVGKMHEKTAKGFLYEEENNRYRCPNGIYLYPYSNIPKDRRIVYRTRSKECRQCGIETSCTAEKMMQSHMRYLRRSIHQNLFEESLRLMKTTIFVNRLLERFWKIEGVIGEAKNRHHLARAKYRGLQKMQIQAYLSASILNMKRLVQVFLLLFCYSFTAKEWLRLDDA